jgi:hypothetical protein
MAFVTSSESNSASRWRTESGSPASTDRMDRRARPAARVPPGTQNETVFVSMVVIADGSFRPGVVIPYPQKRRPQAPLP